MFYLLIRVYILLKRKQKFYNGLLLNEHKLQICWGPTRNII